ncbi:MAG TPA: MFS transporter, partial [Methylomirabilota bacterium]|nr:MFS transporter [Methylomirabilota bacterium]
RWFKPAAHQPLRSEEEIKRQYPLYRWRIFEAAFVAYAAFYIVRNNFAPVSKEIGAALHYDKDMIGNLLAGTAIAYGIGKFVMGYLADRSDARKYVALGMLLTAGINFLFGATRNYGMHLFLWTLNGFVQGMGYGPCTRGLSHWYSVKERGTIFGVWNISHNVGGGIAGSLAAACAARWGWPSAFYVPGAIAALLAIYLFWRMRDTPQSVGLPAIEQYKLDYPPEEREEHERELGARELLMKYILPNKMLWVLSIANIFVYIARYALVDWGPTYLKEVKGASIQQGGWSTTIIEFAGAAGMLSMGWISDKIGGRRGRVSVISMLPLLIAFPAVLWTPKGMLGLDLFWFGVVGFFVYTPVLFSGVMSLDLTTKKAVGTAAGFVGFFGYVGRVIAGKGIGWLAQHYSWDVAIYSVLGCTVVGIVLLAFTWNVRPRG